MKNLIFDDLDLNTVFKLVRVMIHILLRFDAEGMDLVMKEWRRYRLLSREAQGSFRAAAGIVSSWRREYALSLLIVGLDYPFVSAGVVMVNALFIFQVLWFLCCRWQSFF